MAAMQSKLLLLINLHMMWMVEGRIDQCQRNTIEILPATQCTSDATKFRIAVSSAFVSTSNVF